MTDEWLSAPEAWADLGIQHKTLHKLIHTGDCRQTGRDERSGFGGADLDEFLERHKVAPGSLSHLLVVARGRT